MPKENFDTEAGLLLRISQGDPSAFRQIFTAWSRQVYTLCVKITKDPEQARDLTQEIFVRLWTKREKLSNVHHFKGFLTTMSLNLIRNYLQKKVLSPANEDYLVSYFKEDALGPDEIMEYKELRHLLQDAVDHLPSQLNHSFVLSRMAGMSHAEIAREMKLSPLTVKSHIARALKFIRTYLEEHHVVLLPLIWFCFF